MGCHESRDAALAQQRALYANEGRSGGETTKEADEMSEAEKTQLSEMQERLQQLETKVEEAETKVTDTEQRAERAEDALARERAKSIVNDAIDPERELEEGVDALPELPERARKRVVESVLKGDLPVDDDGKLDEDKITERAVKAARDE